MTLKEASDIWARHGGHIHSKENVEEKTTMRGCQKFFDETVGQLAPGGMVVAHNVQWQNSGRMSPYYWLAFTRIGHETDVDKKTKTSTPCSLSFFCNKDKNGAHVFRVCLECEHDSCSAEGLSNYYKYLQADPELLEGMIFFDENVKGHIPVEVEHNITVVQKTVEDALSEAKKTFFSVGLSFPIEADEEVNRENIRKALERVKPIYDFVIDHAGQNEPLTPPEKKPAESAPVQSKKLPKNIILFGAPGTGKTYATNYYAVAICRKDCDIEKARTDERNEINKEFDAYKKKGQIDFITFHQSYSYEDFVIGLFPKLNTSGGLSYEIKPGAFLSLCEKARNDKDSNYVLVIDEINRGNISKIFGELITLIEESRREGASEHSSALLPYSAKSDGSPDYFSVPPNLYIIGTMNTADRSIQHIDTALRRRFTFVEMKPDASLLHNIKVGHGGANVSLEDILNKLNERIEAYFDREHVIGQAYFTPLLGKMSDDERFALLGEIFANQIIPLLQDYFFDDYRKICYVLGEDPDDDDDSDFIQIIPDSDSLDDQARPLYKVHTLDEEDSPFKKIDGYLKIVG